MYRVTEKLLIMEIKKLNKKYSGITDENRLYWCHGTEGLEHTKKRKFRYPFWKYVRVEEVRTIQCVCINCNMHFFGALAEGVPLSIPVKIDEDDFYVYSIPVTVNGKRQAISGTVFYKNRLRGLPTELINYRTRDFIEKVQ